MFVTTNLQIARFADAMFGITLGSNTHSAVATDVQMIGLDTALNNYYSAAFGMTDPADVAGMLVANLGITDASVGADVVTIAEQYVSSILTNAAPDARGTAVKDILNGFGMMTSDATFGAVATAWNAQMAASSTYYLSNIQDIASDGFDSSVFDLTTGTDNMMGTDGVANTFNANVVQSSMIGGVSNTFASGDKLDGGAGDGDVLNAEVTAEFVGSNIANQTDIQAKVWDIETINLEARDIAGGPDNSGTIIVDAKEFYGVDTIGSVYSDGDLVIENLTTLDNDMTTLRNTDELTIVMDHTDSFNSDEDASDLTVYFDEDYFVTDATTSGAELEIRMVNTLNTYNETNGIVDAGTSTAAPVNALEGFVGLSFFVGDTLIEVPLADIGADGTLNGVEEYDAAVAAIEAALAAAGIDTVSVSTFSEATSFSIQVRDVNDNIIAKDTEAGTFEVIRLVNSGAETLAPGTINKIEENENADLNNSFDDDPATTSDNPLAVNVLLEKVGRDGEGGNLIIGGKDQNYAGPDEEEDQTDGIDQFNVYVSGDADQPSNLGFITSTDQALDTVMIMDADTHDGASLTIRQAFNGTSDVEGATQNLTNIQNIQTVNANGFTGDLTIGTESAMLNVDTFTATGGGDITVVEQIFAGLSDNEAATEFDSDDANEYSVTTGSGSDNITIDAEDGAQVTVTSGTGNDQISVSIDGQDDSGSDETTATISAAGGDNTVTVSSGDSTHDADITTGSGSDTINGNSVNITVDTNGGDDVIYAENTGNKAVAVLADGTFDTFADNGAGAGATGVITDAQLLNGREITVTVAMPESDIATNGGVDEVAQFVNGYELDAFTLNTANELSTERELYEAVADAINNDQFINKLASAAVDSNGNLIVTYLVDGATVSNEEMVQINISEEYAVDADIPADLLTAVREANNDSTITAVDVLASYQQTTTDLADTYATITTAVVATANETATGNPPVNEVQTLTITGDNANDADETMTVTFGTDGVGGTANVVVDLDAGGTIDSTDATAVALAVEAALNGDGTFNAIATAAAVGNVVTITYDQGAGSATDINTTVSAVVGGTTGGLAGAGANVTAGEAEVFEEQEMDLTGITVADGGTLDFLIDGTYVQYVNTSGGDLTGAALEADIAGLSATINGSTYDFTDATVGAGDLTITQQNNPGEAQDIADITAELSATNGTNSTSTADNTVNGGTGDDVIVLSSNDNATDTVVFDTTDIGDDTIVHFEDGANGDVLDFTAWLDNETSASGSTVSEVRVDTTLSTTLTNIVANGVFVEDFDQVQTAYGSGNVTFDTLTDSQLLAALNGTATAGNANVFQSDATANLVGNVGKAILLIQNDDDGDGNVDAGDNFGEYLVAEVTFTDDGANNNTNLFTDATIIGTVDFGETQAFDVANFA